MTQPTESKSTETKPANDMTTGEKVTIAVVIILIVCLVLITVANVVTGLGWSSFALGMIWEPLMWVDIISIVLTVVGMFLIATR